MGDVYHFAAAARPAESAGPHARSNGLTPTFGSCVQGQARPQDQARSAPLRVHTRLADRPEGKRLFDKLRAGDMLVVRWVDRLGRNYDDVCDTIREFMRRGVVIRTVINNFTFDGATNDPVQKAVRDALIGFTPDF
jgi:hypothetical protein